jgi:hypothetical protein
VNTQGRGSGTFRDKQTFPYQPCSQNHRWRVVKSKEIDSYAADSRSTDDSCPDPAKMTGPPLATRVEQLSESAGSRIDAGDVGPLAIVAVHAGKSEVPHRGTPAVLAGDDVVDLERNRWESGLGHPTVFAGVVGASASGAE